MIDKELIHQAAEDIDIFQADLTEEYDQLMEARNKPRRRLRLWPLAAAACVAGIIAIFLAPPRTSEEQPPLAMEETTVSRQLSTVNCQLSTHEGQEPIASRQLSTVNCQLSTHEGQQPRVESQRPTANSQQPKLKSQKQTVNCQLSTVNSQEPLLAEAEIERGALPEMEDPLLAVAAQIQDIRSRGERLGREIAQLTDNK